MSRNIWHVLMIAVGFTFLGCSSIETSDRDVEVIDLRDTLVAKKNTA